MGLRLALLALPLALSAAAAARAAPPADLATDVRRLLAFCHAGDFAGAGRRPAGDEVRGAYGRIAIAAVSRPCALSFELDAGSMTDVLAIVDDWVKRRDRSATFRDPRRDGGGKAIWAMSGSTLKLDLSGQPARGRLVVTRFPSTR